MLSSGNLPTLDRCASPSRHMNISLVVANITTRRREEEMTVTIPSALLLGNSMLRSGNERNWIDARVFFLPNFRLQDEGRKKACFYITIEEQNERFHPQDSAVCSFISHLVRIVIHRGICNRKCIKSYVTYNQIWNSKR